MTHYWCIECGLPSDVPPFGRDPKNWGCWACRGPVVSQVQLDCWDNLPFRARLDQKQADEANRRAAEFMANHMREPS